MCITLIMNGAVSLSMNYLYLPFAHFSFGLLFSNWFLGICKLERLALVMGVEISLSFFFLSFFFHVFWYRARLKVLSLGFR